MPEITITPPVGGSSQDALAVALGIKFQPFSLASNSSALAPASQSLRGTATYATAGSVITGIKLRNAVAAAGTLPTTARFGLADNTGKILVLSGNLNALANWVTGVCPMPFTAPFTPTYSGVYFPCLVVNGSWSVTQPTPLTAGASSAPAWAADGTHPPPWFVWTGQADLPAIGASLTLSNATAAGYWLALY